MDYDAAMLYVKAHPDCTSLDLSEAFGVTVAKAFTFMNEMVNIGLAYKTIVRSPTNNKKIFGYRTIDGFDEVEDSPGPMPTEEILRIARRLRWRGKEREARLFIESTNEWRNRVNVRLKEQGVPLVPIITWEEVKWSTYSPSLKNN